MDGWCIDLWKGGVKRICHVGSVGADNVQVVSYDEHSRQFTLGSAFDPNMFYPEFFWLFFSNGFELCFKATLAIHGLLPLVKRETASTSVSDVSVQASYRDAHITKVEARDNAWLRKELSEQNIAELWRVGTPTLGQLAYSGTTALVRKGLLPKEKEQTFRERIRNLVFTRRNVHSHLDYGSIGQNFGDDLRTSFLPVLNVLATICSICIDCWVVSCVDKMHGGQ
eukprot:6936-Heterococcus_DN1.PRE.9